MGNKNDTPKVDESELREEQAVFEELSGYDFPIENIAFEGGGMKGLAYVGVAEALHKSGVLKRIKRFAGVSSGAVTAALLAIGYTDISMIVKDIDLMDLIFDDTCLSFLSNFVIHYGWHGAQAFDKAVDKWIKDKTGDASITFKQLYDASKVELCILTVNVNYGVLEYCHPKTTPDLEIRKALRMAIAIPGFVRPFEVQIDDEKCHYVDAGVVCNLPINAFDGWWLSMNPEDTFVRRLNPISREPNTIESTKRFETRNMKTIAFQVYSDDEEDNLRYFLDQRQGIPDIPYPDTRISRSFLDEHMETTERRKTLLEKHEIFKSALERLFKVLDESGFVIEGKIKDAQLKTILSDERNLTKEDLQLLFNTEDVDAIVAKLDRDSDGQILHNEFLHGAEQLGCKILYRHAPYKYMKTTSWKAHLKTMFNIQQYYLKKSSLQAEDIDRLVGINTGYVTTFSSDMNAQDKHYIYKKGRLATISFLKHLISENRATRKGTSSDVETGTT